MHYLRDKCGMCPLLANDAPASSGIKWHCLMEALCSIAFNTVRHVPTAHDALGSSAAALGGMIDGGSFHVLLQIQCGICQLLALASSAVASDGVAS